MFTELLWIIGFYVAAAALTHAAYARSDRTERSRYVLVAGNHQMQIEWYVRSLMRFARRTGKDIGITVVLDHSEDETGSIVEKFARGSDHIGLVRAGAGAGFSGGANVGVRAGVSAGFSGNVGASNETGADEDTAGRALEHILRQAGISGADGADRESIVWVDLKNKEHLARLPL